MTETEPMEQGVLQIVFQFFQSGPVLEGLHQPMMFVFQRKWTASQQGMKNVTMETLMILMDVQIQA